MAALILFWDLSVGEPSCYDIFSLNSALMLPSAKSLPLQFLQGHD